MKSRVLTLKDPKSVDFSPYLEPFVLDQERLNHELNRIANPYIRWENGTTLFSGDMAVCRLESDCPRFNKESIRFVAGSGLFHRELEALAVGMTVGETRQIDLPEGRVALTLTQVTNKIVPEISDEMVEKLGLEGIHTVADYTTYLTVQQKEETFQKRVYEPLNYLIRQVIDNSEFVLYQADWQHVVDLRLEWNRALTRREGMTLETMTEKEFEGRMPVKCYDELVALEQREAWNNLCMHLLGRCFAQKQGFQPDQSGYEASLQNYSNSWGISQEEARELEPYESYAFFAYSNLAYQTLYDIVKQKYFKED